MKNISRSGLVLLSATLFAVLMMLALNVDAHWMTAPDDAVERWLDAHRSARWRVDADGAFSYLGRPVHVATAGVVAGSLLAWRWRSILPLALTAYQHSFPSGHVTGASTLLGMTAICVGAGRSEAVKSMLAVLVVAGVLAVAFLALYSRAHIFSDVVGGMVLGGAIVALGAATLRTSSHPTPVWVGADQPVSR